MVRLLTAISLTLGIVLAVLAIQAQSDRVRADVHWVVHEPPWEWVPVGGAGVVAYLALMGQLAAVMQYVGDRSVGRSFVVALVGTFVVSVIGPSLDVTDPPYFGLIRPRLAGWNELDGLQQVEWGTHMLYSAVMVNWLAIASGALIRSVRNWWEDRQDYY